MSAGRLVWALENDFFFLPNVGGAVVAHVLEKLEGAGAYEA